MDNIYVTRSSMPPYEQYIEKIRPLWDSRILTNMGVYHEELEERLKEYLGVPYLSLMVNGHMALEMAIQVMDFPKGGEVITTPFTFASTTHAIVRNQLEPVFCDIKPEDYTIDEEQIEGLITPRTVAILPVHVYGNICNVERIEEIANRHGLKVIYDSCHAFGETYKGCGIGCYGDVSVFSFHATKVFHTIEGGAVAFSDKELYQKLYHLKNFGIQGEELVVDVGVNAKMNEFVAAMGLCNLPEVEKYIALRKEKVDLYLKLFKGVPGIRLPDTINRKDMKYNYGYFPVLFLSMDTRDRVYDALREQGIYARKYFYPLTSQATCFGEKYAGLSLSVAEEISERVLVLPLYPELGCEDIERIVHSVVRGIEKEREVKP